MLPSLGLPCSLSHRQQLGLRRQQFWCAALLFRPRRAIACVLQEFAAVCESEENRHTHSDFCLRRSSCGDRFPPKPTTQGVGRVLALNSQADETTRLFLRTLGGELYMCIILHVLYIYMYL